MSARIVSTETNFPVQPRLKDSESGRYLLALRSLLAGRFKELADPLNRLGLRYGLSGSATIADTATSIDVALNPNMPDLAYSVTLSVSASTGGAASAALVPTSITKATDKFTINIPTAPGAGESVTFDYQLMR